MQKGIPEYNAQSSSSHALLPSSWTTLSPLFPLYNLLPFSLASPGYTPYGRDPSRLLHLLNSIFRFQQSNLDIPTPAPGQNTLAALNLIFSTGFHFPPGFFD